jgi:hypothetical protein
VVAVSDAKKRMAYEACKAEIVQSLERWRDRQPTPTLKLMADNAAQFVRRLVVVGLDADLPTYVEVTPKEAP